VKNVLVALAGLMIGAVVMFGAVEAGRADTADVDAQIEKNARAIEANRVLIAQAAADVKTIDPPASDTGAQDAGSASAPEVAAPTTTPASSEPAPPIELDVSLVVKLWRSGALLGAGVVVLFLLLTFALKVDTTRAFYYSAGATVLGTVVDTIAITGRSPNASMLIIAVSMFVAIVTKGPQLRKT
jgi:hypothetical protein